MNNVGIWKRLAMVLYIAAYVAVLVLATNVFFNNHSYTILDRSNSYVTCPWGNVSLKAAGFSINGISPLNEHLNSYNHQKATQACAASYLIRGYHFAFKTVGGEHDVTKTLETLGLGIVSIEAISALLLYIAVGDKIKYSKTLAIIWFNNFK